MMPPLRRLVVFSRSWTWIASRSEQSVPRSGCAMKPYHASPLSMVSAGPRMLVKGLVFGSIVHSAHAPPIRIARAADTSSSLRPMVERVDGRLRRERRGLTLARHRALVRLLEGFDQADNARRQRARDGRSPEEVVRERLARPRHEPPADPCVPPKALLVVQAAKEVARPGTRSRQHAIGTVTGGRPSAARAERPHLAPSRPAAGQHHMGGGQRHAFAGVGGGGGAHGHAARGQRSRHR
jgi:hypothetical protein